MKRSDQDHFSLVTSFYQQHKSQHLCHEQVSVTVGKVKWLSFTCLTTVSVWIQAVISQHRVVKISGITLDVLQV